ncbi:hypothetical protein [Streptomyces sp. NPDC001297]|uniref:hypothetical protein n=1 Tax=Streptomyces sp. NPDC001297 TaxID=3364559 RepID=UPI0036A593F5
METLTGHLAEAAASLRILDEPDQHDIREVAAAAEAAPLHVLRAVLERGLWPTMTPADRLGLAVAVADGTRVTLLSTPARIEAELTRLPAITTATRHHAAACDPLGPWTPDPDRPARLDRATDHLTAWLALRPLWRTYVLAALTRGPGLPNRAQALPPLADVLAHATTNSPTTTVPHDIQRGHHARVRLSHMPQEWQIHIMSALDAGTDVPRAMTDAAMARALAHNRHGLTTDSITEGTPPAVVPHQP